MTISAELRLDGSIEDVIGKLNAASPQAKLGIKRAVRKLLQWYARKIAVEIKTETQVSEKVLKTNRRLFVKYGDFEGLIWVGVDPLPASEGNVSYTAGSAGATVNGKSMPGTFRASIYSSAAKVWIRTRRNRDFGHPIYNPRRRHKSFSGAVKAGRFPVELVAIELDSVLDVDDRLTTQARARFEELLFQELNYALNLEGKRGR